MSISSAPAVMRGPVTPKTKSLAACLSAVIACAWFPRTVAAQPSPPADATATEGNLAADATRDYFVAPRSWGTKRDTEPPPYVRNLSQIGVESLRDSTWLDVGLDQRIRYEHRLNDFTRDDAVRDQPLLLRHRIFLALKEAVDPLRFTFELEDARFFNSRFEASDAEVNELEPIQMFAELHFRDALGQRRPLAFKAGRMAFELVDRRLVGRNEWRGTTNTFDGFRVQLGQLRNDWQIDLLAVQPVTRLLHDLDGRDSGRGLLAAVGDWRRWAPFATLQPYYIALLQRRDDKAERVERVIHTMGLRAHGVVEQTALDYDLQGIAQLGRSGAERHLALATTFEAGYTFVDFARTRLAALGVYASGDDDPGDGESGRFERLFGFVRPMSDNIYVQMENLVMAKAVAATKPHERLGLATGYARYWIASATDRWNNAGLRDMTGASGDHLGDEVLLRAHVKALSRLVVQVGYTYFRPGEFPRTTAGRSQASHFFYTQVLLSAFE